MFDLLLLWHRGRFDAGGEIVTRPTMRVAESAPRSSDGLTERDDDADGGLDV